MVAGAKLVTVSNTDAMRNFLDFALADMCEEEGLGQFPDGAKALDAVAGHPQSIIVADHDAVQPTWFDEIRMRASLKEVNSRIVLLTPARVSKVTSYVENLGHEVLLKPTSAQELRAKMRELLTGSPAITQNDQRRVERIRAEIPAYFKDEPYTKVMTWDISPLGAFIATEVDRPVGQEVWIRLKFPHIDDPVRVRATIVDINRRPFSERPLGLALSFYHLDERELLLKCFASPE